MLLFQNDGLCIGIRVDLFVPHVRTKCSRERTVELVLASDVITRSVGSIDSIEFFHFLYPSFLTKISKDQIVN